MARNTSSFRGELNTLIVEDETLRRGFVLLPRQVLYARNLSHPSKILYALLLGFAWQEESCFPGYGRLSDDMGSNEKTVRKYMRELQDVHLVSQKRRGLNKTNLYYIHKLDTANLEVSPPQNSGTVKITVQDPPNIPDQEQPKSTALKPQELRTNNKQSNNIQNNNKQVVAALKKIRISEKRISGLLQEYTPEYLLEKFQILAWTVKNNRNSIKKSPAAFFIDAVTKNYEVPPQMSGEDAERDLWNVIDAEKEIHQKAA